MSKWYILYTSSNQEYKVRDSINELIKTTNFVEEVFIPTVKTTKVVRGKKVEGEKKMFPSYVFIKMEMNKDNYVTIINIPKVLGFLGTKNNPEEIPETRIDEYKRRINDDSFLKNDNTFEIGDTVKVIQGPFESFIGTIEGKGSDKKKNILKISISIFGKSTSVEIESNRVEKVN